MSDSISTLGRLQKAIPTANVRPCRDQGRTEYSIEITGNFGHLGPIVELLEQNVVRELYFHYSSYVSFDGHDHCNSLVVSLRENTSLRKMTLKGACFCQARDGRLQSIAIAALLNAVASHCGLETLVVRNYAQDEKGAGFAESIQGLLSTTLVLRRLQLEHLRLSDEDIARIAVAVANSSSLEILSLWSMQLTKEQESLLVKAAEMSVVQLRLY